ncbi:3-dehydrosphinganine reductase TSC10A-like protein [Drosera capensis]
MALFFIILALPLLVLYVVLRPRPVKILIKNRHVFITGGSIGIGLSLAREAAEEGAQVSILARDRKKLEEAAENIRLSTGVDVAVFSADVRDFDAVKTAVEAAGPVDVLVCNHGVFFPQELDEQDIHEVKLTVDVNLMGTFHVIKAALPSMKLNRKARGPASIAIMSSMAGQMGVYGYAAYSASKFGLRGLAEALQQEVIEDDIHVSLICPPPTDTPGLTEDHKRKPRINRIITDTTNTMTADEVAKISLDGIKRGAFTIPCNIDGFFLSLLTAGISPQRSYPMAVLEVVVASLARFIGFFYILRYYHIIKREKSKNRSSVDH